MDLSRQDVPGQPGGGTKAAPTGGPQRAPIDPANAIEIDSVSKMFLISTQKVGRLAAFLVYQWATRRTREELWALRDVSAQVRHGEILGIVGENGSGKSTLLRIVAGISEATSGEVRATGRVAALLDLTAGFHGALTGYENLYLGGAILGMTRDQLRERMPAIAEFSGIDPKFLDTPVRYYSTGMVTRLGFSLAANTAPDIVLVDEVLAVGDLEFQARSARKLLSFRDEGKAMILVSHVLGSLQQVCERVMWIDRGRVRATGPARDVIREYKAHLNSRILTRRMSGREDQGEAVDGEPLRPPGPDTPAFGPPTLDDGTGRQTNVFPAGGCLRLQTTLDAPGRIPGADVIVAVVNETGMLVEEFALSDRGVEIGGLYGRGSLAVRIEPLRLLPGGFSIVLFLVQKTDYQRVLACSPDAPFRVEGPYFNVPGCPTDLDIRYEFRSLAE